MTDNKNTILAIVLSAVVLIAWQFFIGMPQQKARQEALQQQQQQQQQHAAADRARRGSRHPARARRRRPPGAPAGAPQVPGQTAAPARTQETRAQALAKSPRIAIATGALSGSIALKGARIDDLSLNKFHETVDQNSPPIELLSPSGSPDPFYAEFGWTGAGQQQAEAAHRRHGVEAGRLRHAQRRPPGDAHLRQRPGARVPPHHLGRRQLHVHRQGRRGEQERQPGHALPLRPDLAPRHAENRRLLHPARGPDRLSRRQGLQEYTYKKIEDEKKPVDFDVTNGWLGITDKYWAATLLPDPKAHLKARFSTGKVGSQGDLPDRLSARRAAPSRRAPAPASPRTCSPAPRK